MANDGSAFGATLPDWRARVSLADIGFLAFLLLAFVGLTPFAIRDTNALLHGADEQGTGNLARQICYLAVFAWIGFAAWRERGFEIVQAVPVTMLVLLAWCVASAAWTAEPDVTLRRAGLECIIVASLFVSVDILGAERSLQMLRWVLAGVLIVNWLSIPLISQAIHLQGEADPGLVGDWRGLYFHKNIAGSVSALSALVFFFAFLGTRRWTDALSCVGAAAFLLMTHSKTSIALLPLALASGLLYRLAWRRPLDRQIALVSLALIAIVGVVASLFEWNALNHILADPGELSGRSAIWQAEFGYIRDHPLLGSGFGSFADTGTSSPLYRYAGSAWIANVSHGHSGYLQLLVTVGGIGFTLAMLALVAVPAVQFVRADTRALPKKGLLFAIFVFVLCHNLAESDFLESDGAVWVTFLLMLAMLRPAART